MCNISKRNAFSGVKIISIVTACLMLVLSSFTLGNAATALALDTPAPNETVKAGVFSFEGYHMKDENGGLTGYGIEFLNLVSQYSHLNFQYTAYDSPWGDVKDEETGEIIVPGMLTLLERGEIDVVTSTSKNTDREAIFDFSLPIGRRRTILSIQADNEDIIRGSYDTYNGMLIGILAGNSQNDSLAPFAENKFTYETQEFANSAELAEALQKGRANGGVDAILTSNLRKAHDEKELDITEEADFYATVRKNDEKGKRILKEINYAIEQMDKNEGDWKNELFYKYYG
ncbi:MAG: transporter substrate-binding domain-containing protein, partial [Clostridia bacterium]|nr:transporter substrate-binding domain-containing protein [Clostridia bacterium]